MDRAGCLQQADPPIDHGSDPLCPMMLGEPKSLFLCSSSTASPVVPPPSLPLIARSLPAFLQVPSGCCSTCSPGSCGGQRQSSIESDCFWPPCKLLCPLLARSGRACPPDFLSWVQLSLHPSDRLRSIDRSVEMAPRRRRSLSASRRSLGAVTEEFFDGVSSTSAPSTSSISRVLARTFLPEGFPDSVTADYAGACGASP